MLIEHAIKQRNSAEGKEKGAETIVISEEWWNKLHALPFVSRKYQPILLAFSFWANSIVYAQTNAATRFIYWRSRPRAFPSRAREERSALLRRHKSSLTGSLLAPTKSRSKSRLRLRQHRINVSKRRHSSSPSLRVRKSRLRPFQTLSKMWKTSNSKVLSPWELPTLRTQ